MSRLSDAQGHLELRRAAQRRALVQASVRTLQRREAARERRRRRIAAATFCARWLLVGLVVGSLASSFIAGAMQ